MVYIEKHDIDINKVLFSFRNLILAVELASAVRIDHH